MRVISELRLTQSLDAWQTPSFRQVLKDELEQLDAKLLPLQQGLTHGSYAQDAFKIMILSVADEIDTISVKAGVFYTSVIAGCNCADDPTPVDEQDEYCELQIDLNRQTGNVKIIPVL